MQKYSEKSKIVLASGAVFAISLSLYLFTLSPTISWGDSADFAIRLAEGDKMWDGSNRDYDLFEIFLKFFKVIPIGDYGTRANLAAAVFGAIAAGLIGYLSGTASNSARSALFSGLLITFSHTFWLLSVISEVYTFNIVLIVLFFLFFEKYRKKPRKVDFILFCLLLGANLSHHPSGLILFPLTLGVFWRLLNQRKFSCLLQGFAAIIIGGFIYFRRLLLGLSTSQSLATSLQLNLPTNELNTNNSILECFKFILYFCFNFPGVSTLLIIIGFVSSIKLKNLPVPHFAIYTATISLLGINSSIPDKFNIYVLVYPYLAILGGVQLNRVFSNNVKLQRLTFFLITTSIILTPSFYYLACKFVSIRNIDLVQARNLNGRDNNTFFIVPSKRGDTGARTSCEGILNEVAQNSILVADYTIYMPLKYLTDVEKVRPDVKLVFSETIYEEGLAKFYDRNSSHRIYLASDQPPEYYNLKSLGPNLDIVIRGQSYEIVRTEG